MTKKTYRQGSSLVLIVIFHGFLITMAQSAEIRFANYNIKELSLEKIEAVNEEGIGIHPQLRAAAVAIQRTRPDVLLINEIDHDYRRQEKGLDLTARKFLENYLRHGDNPIDYEYIFAARNNTGILSGLDLDGNGHVSTMHDRGTREYGNDSWGYGTYPGQYSMVLLSKYPIDHDNARTFQRFLWKDMPDSLMTDEAVDPEVQDYFRLSSKSHWDVPVLIGNQTIHVLASHPTPQGFDGPEDKNGRRNYDEIRFWSDYIDQANYIFGESSRDRGFWNCNRSGIGYNA